MEKKSTALNPEITLATPQNEIDETGKDYEMLVFCHLRWGFVYQRPQHLISRLSQSLKVLFVEEPIPFAEGEEGSFEMEVIHENLHVLKPKTKNITAVASILQKMLPKDNFRVGWFYSAAFVDVLNDFNFESIVYDCMDELSLFRGADPQLVRQEKLLLSVADVVFTGGKSLFEAKDRQHHNVHCFPSSVDRQHFERALEDVELPADIRQIERPVIGYFGVIDERIDLDLLHKVALYNPQRNFVMLGPVVKISEEDLPREKNIHYLGMKAYKELPFYLAAFDIAMMPFALNDSTKFISPTKTLEYMAAGKPVISTPIKDVERDYSHCIPIVRTAEEFSSAIDKILTYNSEVMGKEYGEILDRTSWDMTANKMKDLLKIKVQE